MSNIIIHDRKIRKKWLEYVSGQLRISVPDPLAIVATQAAYCLGEEWLEEVLAYLDNNISFLENYLQEHLPETKCSPLEGTYLAWVDLSAYGYTQEELKEKILREAQVLIEEGTIFGEEGKGFIRINIACPISILKEGFKRIAGVLKPKGKDAWTCK